jgi:hypothetical protein
MSVRLSSRPCKGAQSRHAGALLGLRRRDRHLARRCERRGGTGRGANWLPAGVRVCGRRRPVWRERRRVSGGVSSCRRPRWSRPPSRVATRNAGDARGCSRRADGGIGWNLHGETCRTSGKRSARASRRRSDRHAGATRGQASDTRDSGSRVRGGGPGTGGGDETAGERSSRGHTCSDIGDRRSAT